MVSRSNLIAITGYATSGKTTVANIFKEDFNAYVLPLAAPIKKMLEPLFPPLEADRWLYGDLKNTPCPYLNGKTPRFAMQKLGTEGGRDLFGEDFWLQAWYRQYLNYDADDLVIVDDLRFTNEERFLRRLGAHIVKVVRPSVLPDLTHKSEQEISEIESNLTYINDGTIEDLRMRVRDLF